MRNSNHGQLRATRVIHLIKTAALALATTGMLASAAAADDVGTLIQFQPQTKANAADVNKNFDDIKTAVNTKTTSGIEFAASDSSVQIVDTSATPTVASTLTLTAPGPGFVKLDFSAYLTIGHTKDAGNSYVVCAIKTNQTSPEATTGRVQGSRRFIVVLSGDISGSHYPHITTQGVYPVAAAGSVTFNTVCYRNTTSNSASMFYRSLTAEFHSDRY
jgi:hypothetical protein